MSNGKNRKQQNNAKQQEVGKKSQNHLIHWLSQAEGVKCLGNPKENQGNAAGRAREAQLLAVFSALIPTFS